MEKNEIKEFSLEDIVTDLFYETEEERKNRLQEEYQISTSEDIDALLSSNLSYSDKLALLKKEKQRVDSLSGEIESAEYKFTNKIFFIKRMIDACNKIKESMKMDIPLCIGGVCISSATFYQLCNFLERHRFTDLTMDQFGGFLLGGVFAPIVTLIYTYYVVKDVSEYKKYQKQIRSYNRKLRMNKRR